MKISHEKARYVIYMCSHMYDSTTVLYPGTVTLHSARVHSLLLWYSDIVNRNTLLVLYFLPSRPFFPKATFKHLWRLVPLI